MALVFCHGLESGPHGHKFQALRAAGLDPQAPDFRGLALAERVQRADAWLAQLRAPPVLVGSSYGGLVAVLVAMRRPVDALVLCAPALGLREPPADREPLRFEVPTLIIHGRRDPVCPIEHSRQAARFPQVQLLEVDDDHRLSASLDLIVDAVRVRCAPPVP